jgi:hypothetical protein
VLLFRQEKEGRREAASNMAQMMSRRRRGRKTLTVCRDDILLVLVLDCVSWGLGVVEFNDRAARNTS